MGSKTEIPLTNNTTGHRIKRGRTDTSERGNEPLLADSPRPGVVLGVGQDALQK